MKGQMILFLVVFALSWAAFTAIEIGNTPELYEQFTNQ